MSSEWQQEYPFPSVAPPSTTTISASVNALRQLVDEPIRLRRAHPSQTRSNGYQRINGYGLAIIRLSVSIRCAPLHHRDLRLRQRPATARRPARPPSACPSVTNPQQRIPTDKRIWPRHHPFIRFHPLRPPPPPRSPPPSTHTTRTPARQSDDPSLRSAAGARLPSGSCGTPSAANRACRSSICVTSATIRSWRAPSAGVIKLDDLDGSRHRRLTVRW